MKTQDSTGAEGAEAGTGAPSVVLFNSAPDPLLARIRESFPDLPVTVWRSYDGLDGVLADARPEVVLAFRFGSAPFPRETFLAVPTLKWIQASSAGVDHWMPWESDKVTVTNASGIHGDLISQYTAWAILNHQLDLPGYARRQAAGEWKKVLHESAAGKTVAVIGFGRIGQEVGKLCRCMGMRVIGVRSHPAPSPAADGVVGIERLGAVLGEADYVSINLPLTARTRNLFDADVLAAIKKGAYLINTGRGGIVVEEALVRALEGGHLSGATIDVFATEPLPADSPFWRMENVVVLPHASGDTTDWHMRVVGVFCENMARWLAGEPLRNVVDPGLGY